MSSASVSTTTPGGFTESAFEAFLERRDEPAWLVDRRRESFARFRAFAWPGSRDEEWRRTDIRGLKLDQFSPAATPGDEAAPALDHLWDRLGAHYATGILHVNGRAVRQAEAGKLGGAVFLDMDRAVRECPEILERHFMTSAVKPSDDIFAALHGAYWSGGTLLYVPKGVKVEGPLFSVAGMAGAGNLDLGHTLVVLEEGAEATLVRETASDRRGEAQGLHIGALEVVQAAGSRFRLVNIQNWDDSTWHLSRERAVLGRDASIQWTVGAVGSRLAKVNQEVALAGQGADAQVNGVMFTAGRQHLAYFTRQDHIAPNTTSDLLYKGGLKGRSRVVWRGMIRVEKDAQKTDAYQKDDNLILSDAARADSIPGLEIEANDVRCTHGATAGRVDEEMIFYSQARGIPRDESIRLIVEGFFANVYDRITLEPVRETLRQAVAAKLGIAD
ncbi:Fe-S cluster assembly protein SufD [Aquisphaera insulae]|uniref:Fe-S cluster assembly protein SufD n=1 Tax=Aquisphaera insulae TaxID=2712864 RepID=UPI0013ECC4CA|nr:Fe-S cluster assembly protein SufD [Aquisphaera insulae]